MPDITFDNFNHRSFEQFTQALSVGVLGSGVLVFGDGPDGGREASYEGIVPFPSAAEKWDGYIVMQAKYRATLRKNATDVTWLASQLRGELQKFRENTLLKRPQYYILASNVVLSGVAGRKDSKGGQQKIDDVFEEYDDLKIEGYRVWHPDVMEALLGSNPKLRQSYRGWLTAHDVLAEAFEYFAERSPDFHQTMLLYLQRELRDQRGTRLQQAGHIADEATPLEQVFTDLPFQYQGEIGSQFDDDLDDDDLDDGEVAESKGLLSELLDRCSTKLDQNTLRQERKFEKTSGPKDDRFLILGGPGQGKSTVSQFMAQILRVRILSNSENQNLSADIIPIIQTIEHRLGSDGISGRGARRFPVRVDLPSFADAISRNPENPISLTQYICDHIIKVTKVKVSLHDIDKWLALYPWALFLDGLDEVPPSGNRTDVIKAIVEFWDNAAAVNADVFMTVTTRPQGYNNELDPELYKIVELSRLRQSDAMKYAHSLANIKIASEEQRIAVIQRLSDASKSPTTALLMISPLQVAIMFALIDQGGHVPRDRWSLFNEYFSVVVRREQSKTGPVGEIVKLRIRPIVEIIQKCGFILQCLSERPGHANSFFAMSEFKRLVSYQLEHDGFIDEELEKAFDDIVYVSTNRLVFLEQRVDGQIEFDVRSLQEYMAAVYLMSGREIDIQNRLSEIADRVHWQHVFKIAASKCFAASDTIHLRDTIISMLSSLDVNDEPADRIGLRGASLALSLLEDGLANDVPIYRRRLLGQALKLTDSGAESVSKSLIELSISEKTSLVRDYLALRVSANRKATALGAWKLLHELEAADLGWAGILAEESWSDQLPFALEIATSTHSIIVGRLASRIESTLSCASPRDIRDAFQANTVQGKRRNLAIFTTFPWLKLVAIGRIEPTLKIPVLGDRDAALKLGLQSTQSLSGGDHRAGLSRTDLPATEPWVALRPLTELFWECTPDTVSKALQASVNIPQHDIDALINLPWIFESLLAAAPGETERLRASDEVRRLEFGCPGDWAAAEERLASDGVSIADLETWINGKFLNGNISDLGVPHPNSSTLSVGREREELAWVNDLFTVFTKTKHDPARATLSWLCRHVSALYTPDMTLSDLDSASMVLARFKAHVAFIDFDSVQMVLGQSEDRPCFLKELCGELFSGDLKTVFARNFDAVLWARVCMSNRNLPGLAAVLLHAVSDSRLDRNSALLKEVNAYAEGLADEQSDIFVIKQLLILIASPDYTIPRGLMEENIPNCSPITISAIRRLCGSDIISWHDKAFLLVCAMNIETEPLKSVSDFILLNSALDQRRSCILNQEIWIKLGFQADLFRMIPNNEAQPG